MSEINDFLSTPDKNLSKNIQFQIYYKGALYDRFTDEKLAYIFPRTEEGKNFPSDFSAVRFLGYLYEWEETSDPTTTEGLRKFGITPNENTQGELNEVVYTDIDGNITYYILNSIDPQYEPFDTIRPTDEIHAVITPNYTLKESNSYAIVNIDGNEYTLDYLYMNGRNRELIFNMNRDHRITISWIPGELEEKWVIIATR